MRRTVITGIKQGRDVCFAGDRLFVATDVGLERIHNGSAEVVLAFKWGTDGVSASADGALLFCNDAKKVHTIDTNTGVPTMTWSTTGEGPFSIAPSPDGRTVIVSGSDYGGTLKVHALGEKRAVKRWGGLRYAQVAWLDATRFVSATTPHSKTLLTLHSADGATLMELGRAGSGAGLAVRDGQVCVGTKKNVRVVALKASADEAHSTVLWDGGAVHALAARGSDLLIASDAGVFLVDARGAAKQLDAAPAIAVAANADRIAFVGADESVVVLS
jgi:DNA-binding beta-propeller fold protein YncE